MPGAGFPRKRYYLNWNRERTAFGTEEAIANQVAIVGELQDAPSFKPSNDPIKTKRHSQMGANSTISKGRFAGNGNCIGGCKITTGRIRNSKYFRLVQRST